jgi:hypothetical protein
MLCHYVEQVPSVDLEGKMWGTGYLDWVFSPRGEEGSCCIRGWVLSSSSEAVVVDSWSLVSPYKSSEYWSTGCAAILHHPVSVLRLILVVRDSLSEQVKTATMPGVDHVACVVGVNSSCFSPLLVK